MFVEEFDIRPIVKTYSLMECSPPRSLSHSSNYRWLYSSGFQKSLRRGKEEQAYMYAYNLCKIDPNYFYKSLLYFVLSDVAIVNKNLTLYALFVIGNYNWRCKRKMSDVLGTLCFHLSRVPKNRCLFELDYVVLNSRSPKYKDLKKELSFLKHRDLGDIVRDSFEDEYKRIIAAYYLSGVSLAGEKKGFLQRSKSFITLDTCMSNMLPVDWYQIFIRFKKRYDGLVHVPLFSCFEDVLAEGGKKVRPDFDYIGIHPTYLFDYRTRLGKRSLSYFMRVSKTIRDYMDNHGLSRDSLASVVDFVEGEYSVDTVTCGDKGYRSKNYIEAVALNNGFDGEDHFIEFSNLVLSRMDKLNYSRVKLAAK